MNAAPLAFVEDAVNRVLRLDPQALAALGELDGRRLRVRLEPPGVELCVTPSLGGVRLAPGCESADVVVIGSAPQFLAALARARRDQPDAGGLRVDGDATVAQRFQRALGRFDVDWEERLARVTSDAFAHALAQGARTLRAWVEDGARRGGSDLGDYLRYDARLLAARDEVAGFVDAVDALRFDADRLSARVRLLEERC